MADPSNADLSSISKNEVSNKKQKKSSSSASGSSTPSAKTSKFEDLAMDPNIEICADPETRLLVTRRQDCYELNYYIDGLRYYVSVRN